MAQICFEGGCEDASAKGFYVVDVCQKHWTKRGVIDRLQINLYYTNATNCSSRDKFDEFDCEATLFATNQSSENCTTNHPMLVSMVRERNLHWNH